MYGNYNNPKKSSTSKLSKQIGRGYSLFTQCSFDRSKNKHDYYRGEDCITKFCEDLRKHATEIINCEKKEMLPLTKEEKDHSASKKFVIYVKKV